MTTINDIPAPQHDHNGVHVGLDAAKKAARARMKATAEEEIFNQIEEITMANAKPNFEKLTNDAANHNQENLDAVLKAGTLFFQGTEKILKTYAALAQESVEKNTSAVKTLMGCKTLNELTETQSRLAQESFEGFVTNATKLSELSVKLATESFEPLNAQLSKTIKKATDSAAA